MHKNYFGLWALLVTALAIIVAISCLDRVSLGGFELKSSGIASRLTGAPSSPTSPTVRPTPAISGDSALATTEKATLDTASQSILIIGDSMLEGLNRRMADYAKKNGHTLNSVIWYSSTTKHFGESDTLKVFIKRFKPTFIFLSLGGNELFVRDIKEQRQPYVEKIIADIDTIPFIWIGPPNWKKDTGINELISRNVPRGCYFKSEGMQFERQKDGAHPTYESAADWVDSIARWMPANAAHPIRFDKPETTGARPAKVVVLQPS